MVMMQMHGENELKKQTQSKIFYCNLKSKNLFNHLCHHCMNSRQIISATLYINTTWLPTLTHLISSDFTDSTFSYDIFNFPEFWNFCFADCCISISSWLNVRIQTKIDTIFLKPKLQCKMQLCLFVQVIEIE